MPLPTITYSVPVHDRNIYAWRDVASVFKVLFCVPAKLKQELLLILVAMVSSSIVLAISNQFKSIQNNGSLISRQLQTVMAI